MRAKDAKKPGTDTADIDLSFITEEDLNQAKVQQLIEAVDSPTDRLINKTINSGENTRLLVSLCKRLQQASQHKVFSCHVGYLNAAMEFDDVKKTLEQTTQGGNKETSHKLGVILAAVEGKVCAYQEYVKIINAQTDSLKILTKLLESLLKRQEDYGPEISKNPTHIEYLARAYRLVNGEWNNLRKNYVLIQKQSQIIECIRNWQGHLDTGSDVKIDMQTVLDYRKQLGFEA